jgi:Fe-S-cluster containining protein
MTDERQGLPVLTCDDCGACCTMIGAPPGPPYDFGHPDGPFAPSAWMRSLPDEIRTELMAYWDGVRLGSIASRLGEGLPCLWFDAQTRRCRHYEHRPDVCQEFEVGGPNCRAWRASLYIGEPQQE